MEAQKPSEVQEPSEEEMEAHYKAQWEAEKAEKDAMGLTGGELLEWEALKLENDAIFYPKEHVEQDDQIIELVVSHLEAAAAAEFAKKELAERFENELQKSFQAILAGIWAPEGPIQEIIKKYFQTDKLKRVILQATQQMSITEVQNGLATEEKWVQFLYSNANNTICKLVVEMLLEKVNNEANWPTVSINW